MVEKPSMVEVIDEYKKETSESLYGSVLNAANSLRLISLLGYIAVPFETVI